MAKTGQKFDINPETFTLANIFAMELQRYHEAIAEIVTMASKEMGIEKVREKKGVRIYDFIAALATRGAEIYLTSQLLVLDSVVVQIHILA